MNKHICLALFLIVISLSSSNACGGGGCGGGGYSCCGGFGYTRATTILDGSNCGVTPVRNPGESTSEEGSGTESGNKGTCGGDFYADFYGADSYLRGSIDGYCGGDINECSCGKNLGPLYWAKVQGRSFERVDTGKIRTYYVAAEEVEWDYAPLGFNAITGNPFTTAEQAFTQRGPNRIGSKYVKCLYREYTSSSFKTLKKRSQHEEHLGFMGPTFHAEVGDILKIVFYNKCAFEATVHPHGVFYNKDGEGAIYVDGTSGADKNDDGVPQGGKHTYVWRVPERAGPGTHDGSSVMWMYHSHHHESMDFTTGLVGNMVITRKGMLSEYNLPKDVDKEVFYMFAIMDENGSHFIDESIKRFVERPFDLETLKANGAFRNSNLMNSINGYIFGNAPVLKLKKGERVRYYIMGMGGFRDLHTPHWQGNVVLLDGLRQNTASLLPAEMVVADMVPDAEGIWVHHCHVLEHFANGMSTLYQVVDY